MQLVPKDYIKKLIYTPQYLRNVEPHQARAIFSEQKYTSSTNVWCDGYMQANVVILNKKYASDFRTFCELNSRATPLLEVLLPGNPYTLILAQNADIRSSLPKYRIYKNNGIFNEVNDIQNLWNNDLVTFFLGCSNDLIKLLETHGIQLHQNVPMYDTNIITNNVNGFGEHLVVSMRPIKKTQILTTYKITEPWLHAHGSPIAVGNPEKIGINDINSPDYGQSVPVKPDELPVFWECGVTSQVALKSALKLGIIDTAITHSPDHMFISDLKVEDAQKVFSFYN